MEEGIFLNLSSINGAYLNSEIACWQFSITMNEELASKLAFEMLIQIICSEIGLKRDNVCERTV